VSARIHRQVKLAQAVPTATIHVVEGDHYVPGRQPDRFAEVLVEACQLVARRVTAGRARRLPLDFGQSVSS
jgi:hypothetical protein